MRYQRRGHKGWGYRSPFKRRTRVRMFSKPRTVGRTTPRKRRLAWRAVMLRRVAATSRARRRLVYPG